MLYCCRASRTCQTQSSWLRVRTKSWGWVCTVYSSNSKLVYYRMWGFYVMVKYMAIIKLYNMQTTFILKDTPNWNIVTIVNFFLDTETLPFFCLHFLQFESLFPTVSELVINQMPKWDQEYQIFKLMQKGTHGRSTFERVFFPDLAGPVQENIFPILAEMVQTDTKRQATQHWCTGPTRVVKAEQKSFVLARQAQQTNQRKTPFICTLWVPIHLSFNSQQGTTPL